MWNIYNITVLPIVCMFFIFLAYSALCCYFDNSALYNVCVCTCVCVCVCVCVRVSRKILVFVLTSVSVSDLRYELLCKPECMSIAQVLTLVALC